MATIALLRRTCGLQVGVAAHTHVVNAMQYLNYIPACPLSPNPSLAQLNATTLSVSWTAPFTQTSVAGILNYTVRILNTVSRKWKFWIVPASPSNVSSCYQADISEDIVHNCDAFHNNESVSRGVQMFIVTNKALSDRKCDRFIVYVSANNVLGESQRSGVEAMFPIGMWPRTRVIASSYMHTYPKLQSGYLARMLLKWNGICNQMETERGCWS